jgi:hypothetical protein
MSTAERGTPLVCPKDFQLDEVWELGRDFLSSNLQHIAWSVLGDIEQMVFRINLRNEWKQGPLYDPTNSSFFTMPSNMHIPRFPRLLIPAQAQTFKLVGCLALAHVPHIPMA